MEFPKRVIHLLQRSFSFHALLIDRTLLEEILDSVGEYMTLLEVVRKNGYVLHFAKEQTLQLCLAAVQQNGHALQYVKEQTPEICLVAVQQTGHAILYVKDQTPELCLAAVQQTGHALQYVREQTPELCMVAVTQSGTALFQVKPGPSSPSGVYALSRTKLFALVLDIQPDGTHYPTQMIQLSTDENFLHVEERTPEICMRAVQRTWLALQYVTRQTPEICQAALEQHPEAIRYVLLPNFQATTSAE